MKKIALLITALGAAALQGCSTTVSSYGEEEYGCSGMPDGIRCMSMREVYKLTDSDDYAERIEDEAMRAKYGNDYKGMNAKERRKALQQGKSMSVGDMRRMKESGMYEDQQLVGVSKQQVAAFEKKTMPGILPYEVQNVVPIRTPAEVMRIGFRAWESKDGILHVPGYVYTEIVERRWMIGEREEDQQQTIFPVQLSTKKLSGEGTEDGVTTLNGSTNGNSVTRKTDRLLQGRNPSR